MEGIYIPFNCEMTESYHYKCPKCKHETRFTDCEQGCEKCYFTEKYVDPDDWYKEQMNKPQGQRAWNVL